MMSKFNRTRIAERQQPVRVGIGINTGEAIYGAIGSTKTLQYTVIGDAVNTASRLCSLAKADEIIISHPTMMQVKDYINVVELPKNQGQGEAGRTGHLSRRGPEVK
jgi:adenylate cyclase